MSSDPIVIVSYARTPIGAMLGSFSSLTASDLGGFSIKAAVEKANIDAKDLDEVIMGCVLPAGIGQAPARQASIKADVPVTVGAMTINKMCGSGLKAIMLGMDSINAGSSNIVCAGGMESMTNAPYIVPKGRQGYRLGHGTLYDHMFLDGLEDAFDKGKLMGCFAEDTAKEFNITRKEQDDFALASLERAINCSDNGVFKNEITPVTLQAKKETKEISKDETPYTARPEKIPQLKPAFAKDGTVTAANSSSISDGAASVVLMKESEAKKRGLKPIAKILAHATNSEEPKWFTKAPVGAIEKILKKVNWSKNDVDYFEINEAFAVVTLTAIKKLNLDHNKVNIFGGACALGHPVGASGARIVCTLLNALQTNNKQKGVAAICLGGGEAVSIAVEKY